MTTQNIIPIKDKILEVIKRRGPSLPVHIANEMKLSMLFASAFLADLLSNKELKISNMRVGNTPIYLIPGQEPQLENYSQHLKSREKDAYTLLKEKKFLEDEAQEPAIRVALRAIKDFATPFQKDNKIFWRYFTIPESEFLAEPPKEAPSKEKVQVQKEEVIELIKEERENSPEEKITGETFIKKVLNYLKNQNKIKLIEETEIKKKEFSGIGRIESDLGEMEISLIAKDKKKLNEKDFEKIKEDVQEKNRIVLLFSNGEIDKKAIEMYRQLKGLIFIKNI